MGQIIGNKSDGHNYHYASLADIARQGIEIPPMRVVPLTDEHGNIQTANGQPIEYVEAFICNKDFADMKAKTDGWAAIADMKVKTQGWAAIGEWVRGARIVVPSSTRSNEAQNYGAALTYARRYTVLTLLGIACDDDDKIETHSEADQKANEEAAKDELRSLYEKAGGADFEKWLKDCGGLTNKNFPALKAKLIKQINANAEKEKA